MKATKEIIDQLIMELKVLQTITTPEKIDMEYLNRVRALELKARDNNINLTSKIQPLKVRFYETDLERSLKSATEQAFKGDPILMEEHLGPASYAAKQLGKDINDRVREIRTIGYLYFIDHYFTTTNPEQRGLNQRSIQRCIRALGVDLGERL
jgi:hypothetical protein